MGQTVVLHNFQNVTKMEHLLSDVLLLAKAFQRTDLFWFGKPVDNPLFTPYNLLKTILNNE